MFARTPTGRYDLTPAAGRVAAVAALLLAFGVLFPPYARFFIGDDYMQLWRIRDLLDAPWSAWRVFGPTWTDWYYRPLQHLWFLGNRLTFGYNPFGYYVLQLDLHLLVVALLYRLARRLQLGRGGALTAAALFALSGAHQETVGWIASVAIVAALGLTLGALLTLERFLRRGGSGWAAATLLLTAAALTAHESAVLTPPLLALFAWRRRPAARRPLLLPLLGAGLLLGAGYVALQLWRPNVHLNAGDALSGGLGPLFDGERLGGFLAAVAREWSAGWLNLGGLAAGAGGWLIALAAVALFAALLWRGDRTVRFTALWIALQLSFVYAAVWRSDPGVFGGRHLYPAWAGVCLLLGCGGRRLAHWLCEETRGAQGLPALAAGTLLLLLLLPQVRAARAGQAAWLNLARRADLLREELQTLLPAVDDNTQLFSARFLYSSLYFPRTAAVWYQRPEIPGGTLDLLLRSVRATPDVYVFDENESGLYLLMPELQEHAETVLLLGKPAGGAVPDDAYTIAGPPNQGRLALPQSAGGDAWTATTFQAGVTAGSSLVFGVWGDPGLTYQVQVDGAVLWEQPLTADRSAGWSWQTVDLEPYWNEAVTITLAVRGSGDAFWANPRLVRGGVP